MKRILMFSWRLKYTVISVHAISQAHLTVVETLELFYIDVS